jgi:hypothetical protein
MLGASHPPDEAVLAVLKDASGAPESALKKSFLLERLPGARTSSTICTTPTHVSKACVLMRNGFFSELEDTRTRPVVVVSVSSVARGDRVVMGVNGVGKNGRYSVTMWLRITCSVGSD